MDESSKLSSGWKKNKLSPFVQKLFIQHYVPDRLEWKMCTKIARTMVSASNMTDDCCFSGCLEVFSCHTASIYEQKLAWRHVLRRDAPFSVEQRRRTRIDVARSNRSSDVSHFETNGASILWTFSMRRKETWEHSGNYWGRYILHPDRYAACGDRIIV